MNDKPYTPHEEHPMMAGEPAVAYGSAAMPRASQYQPTPYELELTMQSEKDSEEWLRPFTREELNRWMDEAEAEIVAGEVLASEEVFAQMEGKCPWLCE